MRIHTDHKNEIESLTAAHEAAALDFLKTLVNLEGKGEEVEKLKKTAQFLKESFEAIGMRCELVDVGEKAAPYVTGVWGEDLPGRPVIFSGHFDTVFWSGTYGNEPFRIEDGRMRGPGALDMKGGIAVAWLTVKTLIGMGFDRPIRICWVSDEELGHRYSRGPEVIRQAAEGGLCCFNMETGNPQNELCTGRKACLEGTVKVTGVDAHAGNKFEDGRSAIAEAAAKICEIQKLIDLEKGTTINFGVIQGGTVMNCVPLECTVKLDMRFRTAAAMEETLAAIREICAKPTLIDGTVTEFESRITMPAFETTEGVERFYRLCADVAEAYGYDPAGRQYSGGGSDAAYFAAMGTPALCSFGVQGEHNHTAREYSLKDSLVKRARWIAAVCLNAGALES